MAGSARRVMVVGLVAAQLGLHVLLTATAAHPTHHLASALTTARSARSSLDVLSMSWQMAMAHALSAVLTVVVWSVVAGALEDIVRVPDQPSLAVQGPALTGQRRSPGRPHGGRLAIRCPQARSPASTLAAERLTGS